MYTIYEDAKVRKATKRPRERSQVPRAMHASGRTRDALRCRFLRDRKLPPDDALAPHPPGQGVCAKLHCLDATDESGQLWCVQVSGGGSRVVRPDDPDARCIGEASCKYHVGWETWEELGEDD